MVIARAPVHLVDLSIRRGSDIIAVPHGHACHGFVCVGFTTLTRTEGGRTGCLEGECWLYRTTELDLYRRRKCLRCGRRFSPRLVASAEDSLEAHRIRHGAASATRDVTAGGCMV